MHASWAASARRYQVQVIDGGEIIEEYEAGNSGMCSQTYVAPEDGVGVKNMREWAEITAKQMAGEHGSDIVEHDVDLQTALDEYDEAIGTGAI